MPDTMYDDMKFDAELEAQGDDPVKLVKFCARHQYNFEKLVNNRLDILESKTDGNGSSKKATSALSGGVAAIVAAIVVIIDYFAGK